MACSTAANCLSVRVKSTRLLIQSIVLRWFHSANGLLDAFEILSNLKNNAFTQQIPIIFLATTQNGKEHGIKALELGADYYTTKGYNPEEVHAYVKKLIKAYQLFISYSREDDLSFIRDLEKDLETQGYITWRDHKITPSKHWDDEIEKALTESDILLVVLTDNAIESQNVKDEWHFALEEKKPVIPILPQQLEKQIPLRLSRRQHIDFQSSYESGFTSLVEAIQALVDNHSS
jgi:CheY-like chemotaxis protein